MIHVDAAYAVTAAVSLLMFGITAYCTVHESQSKRMAICAVTGLIAVVVLAFCIGQYSGAVYHPCTVSDWNKMAMKCK